MTGTPNQRTGAMSRHYRRKALPTEPGCPWIWVSEAGFSVQEIGGALHVMRPAKSGTHAETDSTYGLDRDGLSIAICRAVYLALKSRGMPHKPDTAQAVRTANEIFDKWESTNV